MDCDVQTGRLGLASENDEEIERESLKMDSTYLRVAQRGLYSLDDTDTDVIEPLPELWEALEAFTCSDLNTRRAGLDRLALLDVTLRSPLAAYILATRLDDPDLSLRTRVVQMLGDVLQPECDGAVTAAGVRLQLGAYLAKMRTRQIYALLQVAEADPSTVEPIACLLNHCPYGGAQLVDVAADRHVSLSIRRLAVEFIARVGYLDTQPALERQCARLEARLNGHNLNELTEQDGEIFLLPVILQALDALRSP
jgi:hypothetical protein